MVAILLPNNKIQVGDEIYPKSIMSLSISENNDFLEAKLTANGIVVDSCSDNPDSISYANFMFTKNTVNAIAEIVQSQNIVRINSVVGLGGENSKSQAESVSFTRTVSQTAHGLTAPCVVYLDIDGKYKVSDRSNTNKHGTNLVVLTTQDTLTLATVAGEYEIKLDIGTNDPNSLVYLSATPGVLTLEEPPDGSEVLIIGAMRGNKKIFYSPNLIYIPAA